MKENHIYTEFKKNIRLQWMIFVIFLIVTVSITKHFNDQLVEKKLHTLRQTNLLAKLENTAQTPIVEVIVENTNNLFVQQISHIHHATSAGTAEAKALTDLEELVGKYIDRKRINLLGSEKIEVGNSTFWSVRVEIAGRLAHSDFVSFLGHFDQQNQTQRITSLQYSPKTSNTLSVVIDFIYNGEINE
jgi:hypothetical protein